ncbi:MAG: hypothetical protein H0W70_00710 [Actinobacteria bacterium]|nr:hypothetical protein [Actinomycetota bacterium]
MTDEGARSDAQLVTAIARGDGSALAETYTRHAAVLHCLARQLCATDVADGIVADVFLLLWRQPETLVSSGGLRPSLTMHTHSRCVDQLRRDSSRSEMVAGHDGAG